LYISLYLCLLLLFPSANHRIVVNDTMTALSTLAAFLGLGFGATWTKRRLPSATPSWMMLTCGGVCVAIAGIVNFTLEVILQRYSSPSLADAFLLAVYPFLFTGILLFPSAPLSWQENIKLLVDCAIIFFSSTLILGVTVIQSSLEAGFHDLFGIAVALAYPVGDMILVGALFILLTRQCLHHPRQPIWAIFIASLIIVVGDLLSVRTQAQAINPSASWLYFFNMATPLALMFAGLTQAVKVTDPNFEKIPAQQSGLNVPHALRLSTPYLLLALMYYVLWVEGIKESALPRECVFGWGGFVLGLIILRQIIAIEENRRLTRDLNQLNSELEERVQQRTSELVRTNRDLRQEMEQRVRVERALRERDQVMEYNATHDNLTGLANRMLFQTCLDQEITHAQQDPLYRFGILYLDLDAFKIIIGRAVV